jgi:hypothetical protein
MMNEVDGRGGEGGGGGGGNSRNEIATRGSRFVRRADAFASTLEQKIATGELRGCKPLRCRWSGMKFVGFEYRCALLRLD